MAGRKSDFTLPTLDDLFSTQELRDDAKLSKIRDIPLELIDDFPDHPFKVRDDEDMLQLVESVKERGVITPATVRQKEDGRYELISGHRRKRACELAGFEALRCEVVDLDRDAATVLMVESNYQRSQIIVFDLAQIASQNGFTAHCGHKHHFHSRQLDVGREQIDIFLVMQNAASWVCMIFTDNPG